MEIPKPVAFAIIAIVLVVALAGVWFFAGGGGGGGGGSVPESAYPKASEGQGVEAYGIQPPDNRAMPAESLPLESGGKR